MTWGPSRLSRPDACEICGKPAEFAVERGDLSPEQKRHVDVALETVAVCAACVSESSWGS